MHLDTATLIAYTAAFIAIIGIFFVFLLSREGRAEVLVWFVLPFLMAVVGATFLVNTKLQPGSLELRLGGLFTLLAHGFAWQAIRVFYHRRPLPLRTIALAASWLALAVFVFDPLDANAVSTVMRIAIIAVFDGLAAHEFWRAREEDVPARRVLFWAFTTYSAISLVRIPFVWSLPMPLGLLKTEIWAVVAYNLMATTLVIVFSASMIALSRERGALTNYRLAMRDELTGVRNRRAYRETLKGTLAQPYALLVFDIDFFKAVNDRFGHQIGDEVIVRAARAAETGLRKCDSVFRIGGEEFACILPNTSAAEAFKAAERVRAIFAALAAVVDGEAVNASMSVGVAATAEETLTPDELFDQADSALYRAKRQGRNRTVVAPSPYFHETASELSGLSLDSEADHISAASMPLRGSKAGREFATQFASASRL